MALRLVEVVLPGGDVAELEGVIEDVGVADLWEVHGEGERVVVRMLCRKEQTEQITDRLRDHYEGREGFRVILLPVEATIPTVPEPGDEPEPPVEPAEKVPDRVSREELYQDLGSGARLSRVYLVSVALSTAVAAVGLLRGDVAVLIGAMVIAPLLGPNMALALASTLGDTELARKAAWATGAGVGVAFGVAVLVGLAVPVDPTVGEIASRTAVGFDDLALALAAGSAGALAYTSGLPSAVIGVMVAVALLPPTAAAGLLLGAGERTMAGGAAVLVLANVTCLNLAAVATFLVQQVRPRSWWEEKKARKATRIAIFSWVVMLAILSAIILFAGLDSG